MCDGNMSKIQLFKEVLFRLNVLMRISSKKSKFKLDKFLH